MSPQPESKQPEGTKLVLIALGLALLAVLITFAWIESIKNQIKTTSLVVYVLSHDVPKGKTIEESDFAEVSVPKEQFGAALEKMKAASSDTKKNFLGKKWPQDGFEGELITRSLLSPTASMADAVPPPEKGLAHYAVKISDILVPGDMHGSDLAELRVRLDNKGVRSWVVVYEKVKVVVMGGLTTVNDTGTGRPASFRAVTLEVPDTEVTQLQQIIDMASGEIQLVRINPKKEVSSHITKEAVDILNQNLQRAHPPDTGGN